MATIDATVGGATSNSYVTIAQADEMASVIVSASRASAWKARTTEEKTNALIRATKYLDIYFDWEGARVSDAQALAWPRMYFTAPDYGTWYAYDQIPVPILDSDVLFAIYLTEGFEPGASPATQQSVIEVKLSSIGVKFNPDSTTGQQSVMVPYELIDMLNGYGWYTGTTAGSHIATLVRS